MFRQKNNADFNVNIGKVMSHHCTLDVKFGELEKVIGEHAGIEIKNILLTSDKKQRMDNDAFALDLRMCAEQKMPMNLVLWLYYSTKADGYHDTQQLVRHPCKLYLGQLGKSLYDLYYYRILHDADGSIWYKFEQPEIKNARLSFTPAQILENNVLGHALKKVAIDRTSVNLAMELNKTERANNKRETK